MAYLFLLLLLASLVLLVIGLFNPAKVLFGSKINPTRINIAALYTCAAAISLGLMVAVLPEEEEEEEKKESVPTTPVVTVKSQSDTAHNEVPANPAASWVSAITLSLPLHGSDYSFPATIQDLQTQTVKNVFTIRKEAYAPLEKEDGVKISFTVTITNPYDKDLVFPFDTDFYLGHPENAAFTNNTQRKSGCSCDANHYCKIYTAAGKLLDKGKFDRSCSNRFDPCIPFAPYESKTFTIRFSDPVRAGTKNVWLHGFNLQKDPDKRYRQDKGWFLNLEEQKFSSRDTTIR